MKKTQKIIYIVFFFAAVLLPALLTLFGVKSVNYEKRSLAEAPALLTEDGINLAYTKDFDAYFSDNFALRPYFVTAYARILKTVFETSAVPSVVVGKEDSLFLTATVYDYQGQRRLTEAQLNEICVKIKSLQDAYEAQGIAFYFVSAPNKNTIYPEYMPNRYVQSDLASNYDRLYEMMQIYGIHSVYLKDVLRQAKDNEQVYYNNDSHWNNLGAVVAYNEMMKKTADLVPDFTYVDFINMSYQKENSTLGGTATMLFPASGKLDMDMIYDYEKAYTSKRPIINERSIVIETENDNADIRALIFRDSFFNALVPFFSENFAYVQYNRSVPYDFGLVESADPDIVILEIVERNIPRLLENLE